VDLDTATPGSVANDAANRAIERVPRSSTTNRRLLVAFVEEVH